jgi:hypothetical protein
VASSQGTVSGAASGIYRHRGYGFLDDRLCGDAAACHGDARLGLHGDGAVTLVAFISYTLASLCVTVLGQRTVQDFKQLSRSSKMRQITSHDEQRPDHRDSKH